MRKTILCFMAFVLIALPGWADEGMWIPMLLKKYNIEDMQKAGFKLTAEDIYNINQASLKDAVIGLGREGRPFHHFCTGEIVSNEGLVITNHHCAYGMVQSHTTLEKNYLRDGFWAFSKKDELRNPNITASILVRMEDVTEEITARLNDRMTGEEREKTIAEVTKTIVERTEKGTNLKASVKPYFNGNQYFLSVFKIYKDVRLVGVPASAIGKFGGDTDNWAFPRHTGDFTVLRIYAGKDNEPAEISSENVPYKPAKYFKVSTRGVREGDFTMVFGYPGTTREYLPSFAIDQIINIENPTKVKIRDAKLNVINKAMNSDEALRIKYAAKAASVANNWKKWQGEVTGLKRFQTAENKRALETQFNHWVREQQKKRYQGLTERFQALYATRADYALAAAYAVEAGLQGAEVIALASMLKNASDQYDKAEDKAVYLKALQQRVEAFYKDYDGGSDQQIMAEMLRLYNESRLDARWMPACLRLTANQLTDEGIAKHVEKLFSKSIFSDQAKVMAFLADFTPKSMKKLEKDPIYRVMEETSKCYNEQIRPGLTRVEKELNELNRLWVAGLMEMQPDKVFYPDANSTLRVAYGKVAGYKAKDGVRYAHYTTLRGIMEKDNPAIYDYDVPDKLKEVYRDRDFGPYTQDGEVPVCFIATNHTTGGNSGSPVLDAEGNLIGVNFDRAWEGVMSDMHYTPEICRNIAVDIRYVLFIIDKVAGATHLIEEMDIVR